MNNGIHNIIKKEEGGIQVHTTESFVPHREYLYIHGDGSVRKFMLASVQEGCGDFIGHLMVETYRVNTQNLDGFELFIQGNNGKRCLEPRGGTNVPTFMIPKADIEKGLVYKLPTK